MANRKKSMTLHDLMVMKIKGLYDVETQLVKALPKMAKAATDEDLKARFEEHLEETEGQVKRLEQIFKLLKMKPAKVTVDGIRGLISDAEWCIKNIEGPEALDAILIAAAQYVEHYEMAGYGSAAEWADTMGHEEIKDLLAETLEEEKAADEKLNDLATSAINERANNMHSGE